MHVRLSYGAEYVPVDVPDNWINGRCYRPKTLAVCADARAELMGALASPVGSPPLDELASGKSRCVIAIDPSVPAVCSEILPALIEMIEDHSSLSNESITLLIAAPFGSYVGEQELANLLDDDTRSRFQVEVHDPVNTAALEDLGPSTRGIPITVNRTWMEADFKVALGAVLPELLLGFSGGRGIVSPGLSGYETLSALTKTPVLGHKGVRYGNFRDNPFHVHAMESMQRTGCDLCVSVLVTPERQVSRVFAGHFGQSHFQAMTAMRDSLSVTVKEPMDIVITSGGGAPADSTLISLVNTLSAVASVLKPDGTIVVAASLANGAGAPVFEGLIRKTRVRIPRLNGSGRSATLDRDIAGRWEAQILTDILRAHEVIVYSKGLPEEDLWSLGLTPAADMNEAILGAMESHGQRCKIVALPDGPYCLGSLAPQSGTGSGA